MPDLRLVRWEILLLRIAEVAAADVAASLLLNLGWRDLGIHAGIAALGVARAFFSEWRREVQASVVVIERSNQVRDE